MTPRLRGYSTEFSVKLAGKFYQQAEGDQLSYLYHSFSDFEEHALVPDKKERSGRCVTHIVPSITRILPGSNQVTK